MGRNRSIAIATMRKPWSVSFFVLKGDTRLNEEQESSIDLFARTLPSQPMSDVKVSTCVQCALVVHRSGRPLQFLATNNVTRLGRSRCSSPFFVNHRARTFASLSSGSPSGLVLLAISPMLRLLTYSYKIARVHWTNRSNDR